MTPQRLPRRLPPHLPLLLLLPPARLWAVCLQHRGVAACLVRTTTTVVRQWRHPRLPLLLLAAVVVAAAAVAAVRGRPCLPASRCLQTTTTMTHPRH